MTAKSDGSGPGIGCTCYSTCGNITITGGTIIAKGIDCGAGIGGGNHGDFTSITITDGITSIQATAGHGADAKKLLPIGKAYEDEESGSVTIDGVTLPELHKAQVHGTEPLPALPHLNWTISEIKYTYDTWTLTPKP